MDDLLAVLLEFGVYIGLAALALFLVGVVFTLFTRVFWLRTIICMGAAIGAAAVCYMKIEDWVLIAYLLYFVMYFFLFAKLVGKRTGEVEVKREYDFERGVKTTTQTKLTHTLGVVIGSAVLTWFTGSAIQMGDFFPFIAPGAVLLIKVLRILSHKKNGEAAYTRHAGDGQDNTTTQYEYFK